MVNGGGGFVKRAFNIEWFYLVALHFPLVNIRVSSSYFFLFFPIFLANSYFLLFLLENLLFFLFFVMRQQ